jgi:hypothetical protein
MYSQSHRASPRPRLSVCAPLAKFRRLPLILRCPNSCPNLRYADLTILNFWCIIYILMHKLLEVKKAGKGFLLALMAWVFLSGIAYAIIRQKHLNEPYLEEGKRWECGTMASY